MPLLLLLDNRTLFVCMMVSAALFALGFARTWSTHRGLRGAGHFALAYFSATVGCLLFAAVSPSTPLGKFFNTTVGDTLICCTHACMLLGIERFFGIRRATRVVWYFVALAGGLFCFFTHFHDSVLARIAVMNCMSCTIRLIIGIEVLRCAGVRKQRTLGILMLVYAAISLFQSLGSFHLGVPADYMRSDIVQTSVMFSDMLFIMASGLLLFLLLNDDLVAHLEGEAERDFMSGALNRRGIERALRAEMERSRRHGGALTVGLIDLDYFKQINDTQGHSAGDLALTTVADAIVDALRAYDYVGRFGGDEFLVIFPDTAPNKAMVVIDRIQSDISSRLGGKLTLSVGLSAMAEEDQFEGLLVRVDQALYAAKKDGRNCTRLYLAEESTDVVQTAESLQQR